MAITKYHRRGGLSNRNLFLTVLEAEVQDQGAGKVGFNSKASALGLQAAATACVLTGPPLWECAKIKK